MSLHRVLAAGASTAALLVLAGCGSSSDDEADAGADGAANESTAQFPITIEHVYGETVIEEKPERIATVAWSNHEVPLALGVVPVGMSEAAWGDDDGDGVLPWVEERLEDLDADTPVLFDETEGIDFEAVADTAPDVILASYSGLTQEEYDQLSKIAPVVAYPEVAWGTSVQDMIRMNSEAIGLGAEGEQLIEDLDAEVAESFEAHPALAGKNAVFTYIDPADLSQIGFYTTHDTRPGFLESVGMGTPAVVAEASAGTEEFYTTVSSERADEFDDVDLFITYGDAEGKQLKALQADPLIGRISAVESGSVATLVDSTPLAAMANPSPLSIPWGIDDYFSLMSEALENGQG
ncbi:iron-siderophore ABC transporter substrate-binding protein [Nocardioides sp.]|uniref:iron-siderophore ABC transporter substrate-binding protein n=1 Tax=Nocardioides sp. TaxID=35761 RepID=UPI003D0C1A3F